MAAAGTMGKAVTLLGAGTQGRRLAFMWSRHGKNVHLVDAKPSQLTDSLKFIEQTRQSNEYGSANWGSISTHTPETLEDALRDSWLVIENVPEKLPIKRDVIAQLDKLSPAKTIIASNSSSYTISEIINGLELKDSTRILSAHSYWPPETSVLEIMGHEKTNPDNIATLMQESQAQGFLPFHCRQSNSTGYIYNRIWAAIKRESLLAASEGVATPKEIDEVFKAVLKAKSGPFEQMDIVGLDVVYDIEQHYADCRDGIPAEPRAYLRKFVEGGTLGVKSGKGFYSYE